MRWCRAASCGTPPPSCSVTWPAGNRRRLPTDPVVLRGRLPLSLRATRKPHKVEPRADRGALDRKSTRLNSSHGYISYAVFCLEKKTYVVLLLTSIIES